MSSFVTLWKFRDLPEALLAKGKLEASGIEVKLADDELVRMDWLYSNAIGGISLRVPSQQASDALELLQEPVPDALDVGAGEPAFLQPRCPNCGSLSIAHEGLNKLAPFGHGWPLASLSV